MPDKATSHAGQRIAYGYLCSVPLLVVPLVAVRALRIPVVHHAVGFVVFGGCCLAAWMFIARVVRAGTQSESEGIQALAGVLLIVPNALMALLWVGLGAPWDATPAENRMRYLVLLACAVAVTWGLVTLKEALSDAGEKIYSTIGFGGGLLAGAAYVVWLTFQVGAWSAKVRLGETPSVFVSLNDALDTLLFVACALTYLTAASFAASLGKARWVGRGASLAFVVTCLLAFGLLAARGLPFPDPTARAEPWYARPGFIAGIPAVPWVVPHLFGAVLLRRSGTSR